MNAGPQLPAAASASQFSPSASPLHPASVQHNLRVLSSLSTAGGWKQGIALDVKACTRADLARSEGVDHDTSDRMLEIRGISVWSASYEDLCLAACFSGLAAGILGLTNIPGFLLYLITAVLCAGINAALKCGFDVAKYVPQAHSGGGQGQAVSSGKISVWKGYLALSGLGQEGLLGFLLFWIGGYALIHVYD